MAKKSSKSTSKYQWAWVKTNTPGKASDAEKAKVSEAFAPLVQTMSESLPPLREPQEWNQPVAIFSKWYRNYILCDVPV
jgi:hypothetical protein